MCGIAGYINLDERPADAVCLEKMIATLDHRGPDGSAVSVHGNVGLAHSRLSIIDLAGGTQPMSNAEGTIWITFNGEIFNYVELRDELIQKGRTFLNKSDTEVVLRLYEEYGTACVERMNGQWAFAIWDAPRRRLFLSRDRLGVRPLFYGTFGRTFVFGSEAKALLAHPAVDRDIDLVALGQVFTFWFPLSPRTCFKNILEISPGHSLVIENGRVRMHKYWQLEWSPEAAHCTIGGDGSEAKYRSELYDLLVDATRIRLRADVPVAAYLSGGLDSSIVSAIAHGIIGPSLNTFSVSFKDQAFDESEYQLKVAENLGARHHSISCSAGDIARVFPDVVRHAERPVLRTAPAPLLLLSRLVHKSGFKVVLTGEGADEFFGGYDIYKEAKVRAFWGAHPDSRMRPLLLKRLYPYLADVQRQPLSYLQAFFKVRPEDMQNPLFSHVPRWQLTSRLYALFSPDVRQELVTNSGYGELIKALPGGFEKWPMFSRAQYLESAFLLPQYLLSSQGDRVAMANSVEGRYPFLDHRVVQFCASLPMSVKMKVLNEKYLLKQTFGKLIPDAVRQRKKQPYRAPDASSFFDPQTGRAREEYVDDLLSPEALKRSRIFDSREVGRAIGKARRGQTAGFLPNAALVGIISTQLMVDQFISSSKETLSYATN